MALEQQGSGRGWPEPLEGLHRKKVRRIAKPLKFPLSGARLRPHPKSCVLPLFEGSRLRGIEPVGSRRGCLDSFGSDRYSYCNELFGPRGSSEFFVWRNGERRRSRKNHLSSQVIARRIRPGKGKRDGGNWFCLAACPDKLAHKPNLWLRAFARTA